MRVQVGNRMEEKNYLKNNNNRDVVQWRSAGSRHISSPANPCVRLRLDSRTNDVKRVHARGMVQRKRRDDNAHEKTQRRDCVPPSVLGRPTTTMIHFFRANACLGNLSSFSGNSIRPMRHACKNIGSNVVFVHGTLDPTTDDLRFPAVRVQWPRSGTTAVLRRGRSPRAYLKFWLYTFPPVSM